MHHHLLLLSVLLASQVLGSFYHRDRQLHYHNFSQIYTSVRHLARRHAGFLRLDESFVSRQGRPQLLLRLTNFSTEHQQQAKVRVLLSYGEHARELFPVESALHLLANLTNGPQLGFSRWVLDRVDLFIVVLLNPDGRLHAEQTGNLCWRGTSTGVDLNRNFDWNFGGKGSSAQKGNEELRGPHPFSEPESLVLAHLTQKYQFDAFISFHSGAQEIYLPFADSLSNNEPHNYAGMLDLARELARSTGLRFKYGPAWQLSPYPADGTIFDFMAGVRQIPFSLAVELWGKGGSAPGATDCFRMFNPPGYKLKESLASVHPIYSSLFAYLVSWKENYYHHHRHSNQDGEEFPATLLRCWLALLSGLTLAALWALSSRTLRAGGYLLNFFPSSKFY